jgi:nucleotide-binding universal stress UspA family protein
LYAGARPALALDRHLAAEGPARPPRTHSEARESGVRAEAKRATVHSMTGDEAVRRVCVGFDGRARSEPAVLAALALRRALGAVVEVVFVSDIRDASGARSPGALDRLWEEEARLARDAARASLARLLGAAGAADLDVDELLTLDVGAAPHVLVEHVGRSAPSLLVLGPHEQRGRFDFGSTARAVMAGTRCHVWVQPGPFRGVRSILVSTDLSEHSLRAVRVARDLAAGCAAHVTVLHCYVPPSFAYSSEAVAFGAATFEELLAADRDDDRQAFDAALAAFDWQGVEHGALWLEGQPADVIVEQGAAHDLIVLGTHGRTGLSAALLGNVAYSALRRSEVPVLAVRMPKRSWLLG